MLEYNLTRKNINYALSRGVIALDKSTELQSSLSYSDVNLDKNKLLVIGDYYFYNFLNSKVKLTDLGMYILETIKSGNLTINNEIPKDVKRPKRQHFSGHYPNGSTFKNNY